MCGLGSPVTPCYLLRASERRLGVGRLPDLRIDPVQPSAGDTNCRRQNLRPVEFHLAAMTSRSIRSAGCWPVAGCCPVSDGAAGAACQCNRDGEAGGHEDLVPVRRFSIVEYPPRPLGGDHRRNRESRLLADQQLFLQPAPGRVRAGDGVLLDHGVAEIHPEARIRLDQAGP